MASPAAALPNTPRVSSPSSPAPAGAPRKPLSFLKKLGQLGLDVVTKVLPVITSTAKVSEPIVDLLFPLEGPVFNAVVNAVCLAEVAGQNAAATQPTGQLKFQAVLNAVGPQLLETAHSNGLLSDEADASVQQYIQAVFSLLNGPVKLAPTAQPTSTPATTATNGADGQAATPAAIKPV